MSTSFNFCIDWRRKGLICWDAYPDDALNLLPRPLTYTGIDFRQSGVVASAALTRLEIPDGDWGFTVQTGTGVNSGLVLGQEDGTLDVDDIPVSGSAPYSVSVWVRRVAGLATIPFILRVKDQSGAALFSSSSFTMSTGWQLITASGITDSDSSFVQIEVVKDNDANDVAFQAVGFRFAPGIGLPSTYNESTLLDLPTIDYRQSGVVAYAERARLSSPNGYWGFRVVAGTGVNNGLVLGEQDGTLDVDDFPVSASSPYSVGVWVRGVANFGGVPFVMNVKDQTGTTLFSSSGFTMSADWQRITASGSTAAGSTHIQIEIVKNNNAASANFEAVGFMLVAGSVLPSGYNAGDAADLYDNVSDRVMDAEWFLGIHRPYQDDADDSILRLRLKNSDKYFSPEYSSSPLEGVLAPYRPVIVRSINGTTIRTHWTGWLESIQPSANQYGERIAEIKAAGPMLFFEDTETNIIFQENKRTDEIIATLLAEVPIPPPLAQAWVLGLEDYGKIDISAFVSGTILPNSLEEGKTTLAYAADNWVRQSDPDDDKPEAFNVYRAIKDVVAAERGRFLFDRFGRALFWSRHHLLLKTKVETTFDNSMTNLSYEYAALGEFKNDITVTCHPRTVSVDDNELLWTLDQPVTIGPGETRKITASYRDESENRIGGKDVRLEGVTFSEGYAGIAFKAGANKAVLEITNSAHAVSDPHHSSNKDVGLKNAVLATAEVRGKKITSFGRKDANAQDLISQTFYGRRTMNINVPSLDNLVNAQSIAEFELGRRAQPSGKVKMMSLRSHPNLGISYLDPENDPHTYQLALTVGDQIRIQEAQTSHDDTYFIIGEAHRISQNGSLYETSWYLEPTEGPWWILGIEGYSEVQLATKIAY